MKIHQRKLEIQRKYSGNERLNKNDLRELSNLNRQEK